jgi:NAD(P)H-hydrate epimerase
MQPVAVFYRLGTNGGDGFVAARHLAAAGWPVKLTRLGSLDKLTGEAVHAASVLDEYSGALLAREPQCAGILIDAMFGAGLSRLLDGVG